MHGQMHTHSRRLLRCHVARAIRKFDYFHFQVAHERLRAYNDSWGECRSLAVQKSFEVFNFQYL